MKELNYNGVSVKLQIWDTAGDERFKSVTTAFYKGVDAVIAVYDITNRESFIALESFMKDIDEYTIYGTPRYIFGNKVDLEFQRQVAKYEGQ